MKTSLYVAILIAAVVIVSILSYAVLAQSVPFDRDLCIQNCAWLRPHGRNYGQYQNYANCMARCESEFWKRFDKNSEELEKELKRPKR